MFSPVAARLASHESSRRIFLRQHCTRGFVDPGPRCARRCVTVRRCMHFDDGTAVRRRWPRMPRAKLRGVHDRRGVLAGRTLRRDRHTRCDLRRRRLRGPRRREQRRDARRRRIHAGWLDGRCRRARCIRGGCERRWRRDDEWRCERAARRRDALGCRDFGRRGHWRRSRRGRRHDEHARVRRGPSTRSSGNKERPRSAG